MGTSSGHTTAYPRPTRKAPQLPVDTTLQVSPLSSREFSPLPAPQLQVPTPQQPAAAPPWACTAHGATSHDFFLSYRVAADGPPTPFAPKASGAVKALYEAFEEADLGKGRKPVVFWDTKCLNYGEDWRAGFSSGLLRSSVVVLLVSKGALERMRGADKRGDNLLLEW